MGFLLQGENAKHYDALLAAGHTEHCAYDMVFFNQPCMERCLFKPVRVPARTDAERAQKYREVHSEHSDKGRGRPRKFQTNAERQKAYRLRHKAAKQPLDTMTHTGLNGTKVLLECSTMRSDNQVKEKTL